MLSSLALGKDVRLLLAVIAIVSLMEGFLYTVLQLYLKSVGCAGSSIGTFMLVLGLSSSILLFPSGILSDRLDRRGLLGFGTALMVIGLANTFLAKAFSSLLISACLWGAGTAMYGPSINSTIADRVSRDQMEAVYTVQAIITSSMCGISSLMCWMPEILAASGLGYSESYLLSMSWMIPAGLLAIFLITKVGRTRAPPRKSGPAFRLGGSVAKLTLTQAMIGFGTGLSIPMLTYYFGRKFLIESGPIGTLNAAVCFIAVPFMFLVPSISRRVGGLRALILPQLASIPLLIMVALSMNFFEASVFFVLRQILVNMSGPIMTTFTMNIAREEERGTVNALAGTTWRLPNSLATQVGGSMFDVSLNSPLYATAAIYAVYLMVFYSLFHRTGSRSGSKPDAASPAVIHRAPSAPALNTARLEEMRPLRIM